MNKLLVFLLLFSKLSSATEYLNQKIAGNNCVIEACRDIDKPVNSNSWCDGYDNTVAILEIDPNYIVPDFPPDGPNVSVMMDGDQVQYFIKDAEVEYNNRKIKTDIFVDGFWWDKFYERYHLYVNCN